MISLNSKEITQIYRDDSLVEYIYKGDRPIYDCMIDYVLNDDGTCYVNRAGQTNVARQENIEYLYIPNKICKNSRIYEVTQVGTRDGYNNKFRTLKKALIGAPTDESGKMAIVDYGFEDRTSLEEVVITDSVFSIGKGAFLGCNKIAKMTLPPCASRLDRIFGNQVDTSTGELVPQSLKTVTIHSNRETFKRLQDRFFYKCRYIETVNIDIKNLESIGDNAFEGCSKLKNITIPDSVTSIGKDAFKGCDNLEYNGYDNGYYLGNSNNSCVVLIKAKNKSISSCRINENTKVIYPNAFRDCSGLTSVTIPDSVTSIGKDAFSGCYNLEYNGYDNGYYLGNNNNLYVALIEAKNTSISSCTINENTKVIYPNAFRDCSGLKDITIPNSVTSIGENTFYSCGGLESVAIPDSVTSIGKWAFYYCYRLTSITIPNRVTSIGEQAFYNCKGLTSITIPDSVTSIGERAFEDCSGIESLAVTTGNTKYHSANNCIIETESKTLILGCKNSVIPSDGSVTSIGSRAFSGCSGLTSITIPNSVTSIGNYAFYYCRGLTSVTIGNSVTSIGERAFSWCSGLTSITIPNSVTSIGRNAFSACRGLTSVTIGNSVTSIGEEAFEDCSGIESLVVTPGNTKYHSANNCIIETESKTLILGCKNSVIPSDGSVTSIGEGAFSYCSGLTSITIPNSVTSIGEFAFYLCSGLTSVTMLPTNPPTLGLGAIPSNVTTITVPVGRGNAYKTAEGWSAYANKIVEATA